MATTKIAERQMGIRTVVGTDWPVVDQLLRVESLMRRPTWQVVRGLCNGVPRSCTEYKTLREARAAFGVRPEFAAAVVEDLDLHGPRE